jgi:virginiamycin B lyase
MAGEVTEFANPGASLTGEIVAGPDGNLWFTETDFYSANRLNQISRITTAGVITKFPIPMVNASLAGITVGADGNLWFIESGDFLSGSSGSKIGRIIPVALTPRPPPTPIGQRPHFVPFRKQ